MLLNAMNSLALTFKKLSVASSFPARKQNDFFQLFYSYRKDDTTDSALRSMCKAIIVTLGEKSLEYRIAKQLYAEREQGLTFEKSVALRVYFASDMRVMFSIVEKQSGETDLDVSSLQRQKDKELEIKKSTRSAILPALLTLGAGLGIFVFSGGLATMLGGMFDITYEKPLINFAISSKNHILGNAHIYLISVCLFFTTIYQWALPNYTGEYRRNLDALPIFSSYKALEAARFFTVLALLKQSGYETKSALNVMKTMMPKYSASYVNVMLRKLRGGQSISAILGSDLLNAYQRVRIAAILDGSAASSSNTVAKALSVLTQNMVNDTVDTIRFNSAVANKAMLLIGVVLMLMGFVSIVELSLIIKKSI